MFSAIVGWGSVILASTVVLIWVSIYLLIVPRIGEFRPVVEARLSASLGVPLRIGSIEARVQGIMPTFEMTGVRLLDSQGRDALLLKTITAAVSPQSLLDLGFEQLLIEQPELAVRRSRDGRWTVAGLDMSAQQSAASDSGAFADWLFSQNEVVIRSGTLQWHDEMRDAPPLAMTQVNLFLRNQGRRHLLRIDATPPAGWGDRFMLSGDLRGPLITNRPGDWRLWRGQVFADFPQVDVQQLRRYSDLGVDINQGFGALRAWLTLQQGQVRETTVDAALRDVNVKLGRDLQPLALNRLTGRFSYASDEENLSVSTQDLAFELREGLQWPGGNLRFTLAERSNPERIRGEFAAQQLDMAALAQISDRLPLDAGIHQRLRQLRPEGQIPELQAKWFGPLERPTHYEVQGVAQGIQLQSSPHQSESASVTGVAAPVWHPGLRNAQITFKAHSKGGSAQFRIDQGSLTLPQVFEQPTIELDEFNAELAWKIQGENIELELPSFRFSNRDAQGEGRAKWHTLDTQRNPGQSRFPGVLDLQGTLSRADGTKVHRYLPLVVAKSARQYVREAVRDGQASQGRFRVKGNLRDMPFADPSKGEFLIAAQVNGAVLEYVPKSLMPPRSLPWPALTQINGELIFDRLSMTVRGANARISGAPSLALSKVEASIADLAHSPQVVVSADARGFAPELIALVNASPLSDLTNKALAQSVMSGPVDLRLRLTLPISNLDKSRVAGTVTLPGNDFQFSTESPQLRQARGQIVFSESGFNLRDISARAFGGDLRIDGGSRALSSTNDVSVSLRAQGLATADGLRQTRELGLLARLAARSTGSTTYTASLNIRRSIPELVLSSHLQGLALSLPQPLSKSAETQLPLKYENTLVRESLAEGRRLQDQIRLEVGSVGELSYLRDVSGATPRVVRGRIGIGLAPGDAITGLDIDGVAANINFGQIDLDAWEKILSEPSPPRSAGKSATDGALSAEAQTYLPSILSIRAKELTLQGRKLNYVVVGGSREGLTWRANIDASELNGYIEYRQPSGNNAGRVYARLARLSLAASTASDLETTLDQQPSSIPAVDLIVEDLELLGKRFGRLEVEAINRDTSGQREWRLSRLNINLPEAQFNASGNWALIGASQGTSRSSRRRTALNFKLDISNSGELLKRFGQDKVIARGSGAMQGQIAWIGAPWAIDYPSLTGGFNLNIENGQFLKTDPGLAKLLGVLSLQSLPRRLALDFRDVFSEGFAFDFIRGDVKVEQGVAFTNNLQMKGVSAAALLEGSANLARETQDIKVVVIPEINAGTASLVATAINPAIGIGTFLAQLILRRPVIEAATQEFHITGSWVEPQIERVKRTRTPSAPAPAEAKP